MDASLFQYYALYDGSANAMRLKLAAMGIGYNNVAPADVHRTKQAKHQKRTRANIFRGMEGQTLQTTNSSMTNSFLF
eukprot:scaffold281626_cov43-Attheya_sp.AAC.1